MAFRFVRVTGAALLLLVVSVLNGQNGELDPTFSLPVIESAIPPEFPDTWVAALTDGRVLVAKPSRYFVNGRRTNTLVRLNPDGAIDATYTPPSFTGTTWIAHVYADGRALVTDGAGQLVRLLANGTIDPAFATTPLTTDFALRSAIAPGGAVWIWGSFRIGSAMTRLALLRPEGGWDETFAASGMGQIVVNDAAVQPDGKLVVAGTAPGVTQRVFRLEATGRIDPSFDASATFPTSGTGDSPQVVAVLPDGRLLVAGTWNVWRLFSNGSRDPSYQPSLVDATPLGIGRASANGVLYYLTSGPNLTVTLRRLNPDGTTDPNFQVQGGFTIMTSSTRSAMPSTADDRTLYFWNAVTEERRAARHLVTKVTANGAIDPAFRPRFSTAGAIDTLLRQPDGKYLVDGFFDYIDGVALTPGVQNFVRLNPNGSHDASFRPPATTVGGGSTFRVAPLAVQPGGRIIVSTQSGVRGLRPDGSFDSSFPQLEFVAVQMDAQGFLYIRAANGPIQRLQPDGAPDPSFVSPAIAGIGGYHVAPDGRMVLESLDPIGRRLTWLRRDGSVSGTAAFNSTYNFSRPGVTLTLLPDASVILCGDLTTTSPSITAARIVRYDPSATQTLQCDVASDVLTVAGVLHDLVAAAGGGEASLSLVNLASRGRALVHQHEVMVLPGPSDSRLGAAYPLGRFRPRDLAQPMTSLAPVIFVQPQSRAFSTGSTSSFTVNAYGAHPRTYQWFRDGVPVTQPREVFGIADVFSLSNVQPADVGDYTVRVTNAHGSTVSLPARLGLLAPPVVVQNGPSALTVSPGQTLALTIRTTGDNMRYTYTRNNLTFLDPVDVGAQVPGGTYTLLVPAVTAADAGVYRIQASNGSVGAASDNVTVTVSPTAEVSRLINASVRTRVGVGDQSLIVGFVVAGNTASGLPVLARGIGPALTGFGVTGILADPQLTLRSNTAVVATNDNWNGGSDLGAVAARVGAFELRDPTSRDAALFNSALAAGPYTLQVTGVGGTTGVALAEVYDATPPGTPGVRPRLTNLSSRAQLDAGESLIAGFVIAGGTARTVLVRAVGPSLARFGVSGFLSSGQLTIYDGNGQKVAENLSRGFNPVPDMLAPQVGAFALTDGANDNAIAITLPPGPYTARVRGTDNAAGVVLIEVYDVP